MNSPDFPLHIFTSRLSIRPPKIGDELSDTLLYARSDLENLQT